MGELGGLPAPWPGFWSDPAVQTGLVPFALALALAALAGALGVGRVASLALGIGFLSAYALFEGVAPFPPPAAKQKLFYLVAFGVVAGLAIDLLNRPAWLSRAAVVAFPLACALWFAWRRLGGSMELGDLGFAASLLGLWAGGALLLFRLDRVGQAQGAVPAGILLIAAALGAFGVSILGASITLALSAGAAAAAAGGLTLWGYLVWIVKGRASPFGAAAVLGGGGALVALAGIMVLYTPGIGKIPLVLLLLCLFADQAAQTIGQGIGLGGSALGRAAGPIVLAALAAVPALAAIGLAYLMGAA